MVRKRAAIRDFAGKLAAQYVRLLGSGFTSLPWRADLMKRFLLAALFLSVATTAHAEPIYRAHYTPIWIQARQDGAIRFSFSWNLEYEVTYDLEAREFDFHRFEICSSQGCDFGIEPFTMQFDDAPPTRPQDILLTDYHGTTWDSWFAYKGGATVTWGALDDSGFTLLPGDEYPLWVDGNGLFDWFWLSPTTIEIVPEPSGVVLAILAAGGFLLRRR